MYIYAYVSIYAYINSTTPIIFGDHFKEKKNMNKYSEEKKIVFLKY